MFFTLLNLILFPIQKDSNSKKRQIAVRFSNLEIFRALYFTFVDSENTYLNKVYLLKLIVLEYLGSTHFHVLWKSTSWWQILKMPIIPHWHYGKYIISIKIIINK